jgi:hypothetical protein
MNFIFVCINQESKSYQRVTAPGLTQSPPQNSSTPHRLPILLPKTSINISPSSPILEQNWNKIQAPTSQYLDILSILRVSGTFNYLNLTVR